MKNLKKFAVMLMVLTALVMGMTCIAHGEGKPAEFEAFNEMKVFQTEGTLSGTWTIGTRRDENGNYPCVLDLGDGRYITVPLTDDEVNTLMCKALEEYNARVKEAEKAERRANQNTLARIGDFITFWD